MKNPYTLSFGKKPTEYINRIESTQEIKSAFLENVIRGRRLFQNSAFGVGDKDAKTNSERSETW